MGNEEYATAFAELVLPVLSSFQPELILVACGLDAAKGDLLGDCGLSPDAYYVMTKSLLDQAGADIPMVVVLEGGYNVSVSADCMENVALALLDEPCCNGQFYDLSRYWKSPGCSVCENDNHKGNAGKKKKANKRKTQTACKCIKKTVLALEGAEKANMDCCVMSPNSCTACGKGPIKKRKPFEIPFNYIVV